MKVKTHFFPITESPSELDKEICYVLISDLQDEVQSRFGRIPRMWAIYIQASRKLSTASYFARRVWRSLCHSGSNSKTRPFIQWRQHYSRIAHCLFTQKKTFGLLALLRSRGNRNRRAVLCSLCTGAQRRSQVGREICLTIWYIIHIL